MCLQSSDNTNILVVLSLKVTGIIWQKMQMWLASKSQNLLHKRKYVMFKYVLDAATV